MVKKLDPIETWGIGGTVRHRVRTTLNAGFHGDVTSCYVKFKVTFLGPSAHPATTIEFKQIESFYLAGSWSIRIPPLVSCRWNLVPIQFSDFTGYLR
jgi:hypothetical protein